MSCNTSCYITDIQTDKISKKEGRKIYFFICKVLVKLAQSTKKTKAMPINKFCLTGRTGLHLPAMSRKPAG